MSKYSNFFVFLLSTERTDMQKLSHFQNVKKDKFQIKIYVVYRFIANKNTKLAALQKGC